MPFHMVRVGALRQAYRNPAVLTEPIPIDDSPKMNDASQLDVQTPWMLRLQGISFPQGEFVLGNLSEKSTIAVISKARPIKWLCREQIHPGFTRGDIREAALL